MGCQGYFTGEGERVDKPDISYGMLTQTVKLFLGEDVSRAMGVVGLLIARKQKVQS